MPRRYHPQDCSGDPSGSDRWRGLQDAADGSQGTRPAIKKGLGELPEALRRHLLDPLDDLLEPEAAVEGNVHLGETGHPAVGALEAEEEITLELLLGASQIRGTHRLIPNLSELPLDEVYHLLIVVAAGPRIDHEETAVAVGGAVRIDGVDEPSLLPDLLEQAGAHPAPEDRIEDRQGVAVPGRGREAIEPQGGVDLAE